MSVLGLLLSLAWSPAAIAAQAGASPFQALLHDGRVVSGAPAALSTQRLVLDALGRPPVVGDEVELAEIRFRVDAIVGRSVREVSLTLPPERTTTLVEEAP